MTDLTHPILSYFPCRMTDTVRVLSWNVNGSANLRKFSKSFNLVTRHDVIHVQESFETPTAKGFHPPGFLKFQINARSTGGRPSGGVFSLFKQSTFANHHLLQLPSPEEWILPVRWTSPSHGPVISVNIYIPRHSPDFDESSISTLRNFFVELRSRFLEFYFIYLFIYLHWRNCNKFGLGLIWNSG